MWLSTASMIDLSTRRVCLCEMVPFGLSMASMGWHAGIGRDSQKREDMVRNLNIKLVHCDVHVWWDSRCCAACGFLKAWHFFVPPWVPPKMRCMFTGEDLLEAHSFCIDSRFPTLFVGIWASTKGCSRPFSPNSEEDSNGTVRTCAFSPIKYGRQVCKWKRTLLKCCFWGSL